MEAHFVTGSPLAGPYPDGSEIAEFGMGCFWGAERIFWQVPGVIVTAAGYQGGHTASPTYEDVCSGRTGHTEVVRVVYDPDRVPYAALLRIFWENHDPTQLTRHAETSMQYRSLIFTHGDAQLRAAGASREAYQRALLEADRGRATTEIRPAPEFYFAEDHHQQYLAKGADRHCATRTTGVACPTFAGEPFAREGNGPPALSDLA